MNEAGGGWGTCRGSLTVPPCSEGLTWIVLTTPVTVRNLQSYSIPHLCNNVVFLLFLFVREADGKKELEV